MTGNLMDKPPCQIFTGLMQCNFNGTCIQCKDIQSGKTPKCGTCEKELVKKTHEKSGNYWEYVCKCKEGN